MNCRCHDCLRIAREAFLAQVRLKKELIHKTLLEAEKVKVPFEKLTSEERISLAILIGDRSSNDLSHIIPFGFVVFKLPLSAQDSNEKPAREEPVKNKTQNSDRRKLVLGLCFFG
jgi:hypothetical protein